VNCYFIICPCLTYCVEINYRVEITDCVEINKFLLKTVRGFLFPHESICFTYLHPSAMRSVNIWVKSTNYEAPCCVSVSPFTSYFLEINTKYFFLLCHFNFVSFRRYDIRCFKHRHYRRYDNNLAHMSAPGVGKGTGGLTDSELECRDQIRCFFCSVQS
jgi:hypothetical protein